MASRPPVFYRFQKAFDADVTVGHRCPNGHVLSDNVRRCRLRAGEGLGDHYLG
jgi:hypothetical protein